VKYQSSTYTGTYRRDEKRS